MNLYKNLYLTILFFVFLVLSGCGSNKHLTDDSISTLNPVTSQEPYADTANTLDLINADKSQPEVKVIYDYAEKINHKEHTNALELLGSVLIDRSPENDKIGYEAEINSMKNIEHMEVLEIIDKTDEQENSRWIINERNIGEVYTFRVYYAEIEYRLNHSQFSYLTDGVNYLKIVTVKEKSDSIWQIGEMSDADSSWKYD